MRMHRAIASLLVLGPAAAQDLVWKAQGNGNLINRGRELRRLGDADGDGWDDLVEMGSLFNAGSPGLRYEHIFVTSGRDGSVMSASPVPNPWTIVYAPLSLAPVGDMNQDGVPDYAVTTYDAANPFAGKTVEVRSGSTHATLWTATIPNSTSSFYGDSIAGEMDLDGDDLGDIVVGATQASANGTLFVYDHWGNLRYSLVDPVWGVLTGTDLAPLGGDMDDDGCDDFVCAGPDYLNRGAVVVFSGLTGAVLRVSPGVQPGDKLSFCTRCGDMDGDGVLDYAGGGFWGASVVTAFSGATGLPIHTWRAPAWPYMGARMAGGFDLDQDGVNDIVAGSDQTATHALSGRDGTFLWTFPGSLLPSASGIGLCQTILAPPPGETYPIMVYAEPEWRSVQNPSGIMLPGQLSACRGAPPGVHEYGQPDASSGVPLPRIGMRALTGNALRFSLSSALPSVPALLVLGVSDSSYGAIPLPAPLDGFGLPGWTLQASAEALGATWTGVGGMAEGFAALDLGLPPGYSVGTTGLPLFAQWLWFDPANVAVGGSTRGQSFLVH